MCVKVDYSTILSPISQIIERLRSTVIYNHRLGKSESSTSFWIIPTSIFQEVVPSRPLISRTSLYFVCQLYHNQLIILKLILIVVIIVTKSIIIIIIVIIIIFVCLCERQSAATISQSSIIPLPKAHKITISYQYFWIFWNILIFPDAIFARGSQDNYLLSIFFEYLWISWYFQMQYLPKAHKITISYQYFWISWNILIFRDAKFAKGSQAN